MTRRVFFSFDQFEKYITCKTSMSYDGSFGIRNTIMFLKEHTRIKKALDELIYIPTSLLKLILDYTATKADPQQILEILIYITPLIYYCNISHLEQFIDEGWDINKLGKYLIQTPRNVFSTNSVRQAMGSIPVPYPKMTTPLIMACEELNYQLIKFYLDSGADVNLDNSDRVNALIVLANQGMNREEVQQCVGLLEEYDLDI